MSRAISINAPGAGDWIMERCEGVFRPGMDHSLSNHRDGQILGGFVLSGYLGASIAVHTAGAVRDWCSRDLMWMVFHYAFRQLKCSKMIAPVASDNHHALLLDLRAGFHLEAVIKDALAPGRHLMLLTMGLEDCRWLRIIPQSYLPGDVARRVVGDGR